MKRGRDSLRARGSGRNSDVLVARHSIHSIRIQILINRKAKWQKTKTPERYKKEKPLLSNTTKEVF